MDTQHSVTKEHILKTALNLLNQRGSFKVTIQEIAQKANVGLGTINYHFVSIDNLIEQALEYSVKEELEIVYTLTNKDEEPENRLKSYCFKIMDHLPTYAGRYAICNAILEKNPLKYMEVVKIVVDCLKQAIKDYTGFEDEPKLTYKTLQFVSSLVYPLLLVQYDHAFGLRVCDSPYREEFIEKLIKELKS